MSLRKTLGIALLFVAASAVAGAQQPNTTPTARPTPIPTPQKIDPKNLTAEQVAEYTIFFYGLPGGRATLDQIRKTTVERGVSNIVNAEGKTDRVPYRRYIIRGATLANEKIRLEQEFPSARFSLVWSEGRTFGVYNDTVFTPREDAAKTFENQIFRGLEALLRFRENGSKVDLASREKILGVDYYVLEITDKQDRKTKFFVSAKSFRVMMLTYDQDNTLFRRKFYDYNYAQGTLVPFRSVLWADDRQVEETEINTITFGQKVDEGLFAGAPTP